MRTPLQAQTPWIILSCVAMLATFFQETLPAQRAEAARPNVLLFVVDDQGRDAGCYGNSMLQTPNLDRLASEGTRFDYAFCTTASCSASRSVLLTGLHNHANGQFGHEHDYHHFRTFETVKSLPVRLSQAGYRTARIGKFHVGPSEVYRFDQALSGSARRPVEMAENCRAWVTAKDERPFFLFFCTADPHRSGDFADDLPGKPDRFGNRPQGYAGVTTIAYEPRDVIVPPFLPDTLECRAELAQYYQAVSRIDQGLGRLIEILKASGQYENTLIVYLSDNGIAFPGAKTTLYEPGMRLPCIVRSPNQKRRGIVSQAMISWTDITPTLLDVAGLMPRVLGQTDKAVAGSRKAELHGRSFLRILDDPRPTGWDEVYASHTFHEITMYYPMRVVRGRQYKLIWNLAHGLKFPFASDLWESPTWQSVVRQDGKFFGRRTVAAYVERPEFELYDLRADPDETQNLAADPRYASVFSEQKAKLKEFQRRTGDPWIIKWEHE